MVDRKHIPLTGRDGLLGWVNLEEQPANRQEALIRLQDGTAVRVPADLLVAQQDGSYYVPLSSEQFRASEQQRSSVKSETIVVIPVLAEELEVSKRQVTSGRVQISKRVREREEVINLPTRSEEVNVERVPVNRLVDTPPEVRYEGDTMVIPVLEEFVVVEKRLRVKEEIRVTRVQKEARNPQPVVLREETVDVRRVEGKQNDKKE